MPTLATYPHVIVTLACSKCPRRGRYRLARLAAQYGPDIGLVDLLGKLAGDCPRFDPKRPGIDRCGAHYAGLAGRRAADAP